MEVQFSNNFLELHNHVKEDIFKHVSKHGFPLFNDKMVLSVYNREDGKTYPSHIIAAHNLASGFGKRFIGSRDSDTSSDSETAITEFLSRNANCCHLNDTPKYLLSLLDCSFYGEILGEMARTLGRIEDRHPITYDSLLSGLHAGPGYSAGLGTSKGNNVTRFFSERMTFSSASVRRLYLDVISGHPDLYHAENIRERDFGHVIDTPAELTTVPKNIDERRVILKQPSGNLVLQLPVNDVLMNEYFPELGISREHQKEHNMHLARLGSLGQKTYKVDKGFHSFHFCTIDSRKASDWPSNLTRKFLGQTKNLSILFETLRCNRISYSERVTRKGKISTRTRTVNKGITSAMGNGFTFPIMTLFFTTLIHSLYERAGIPKYFIDDEGNRVPSFGVWGDDIVCDKRVVRCLLGFLAYWGIEVNQKKSYYGDESFRESCGGDYFNGFNVRPYAPVYMEHEQDICSIYNNLKKWSLDHGILLTNSLHYLELLLVFNEKEIYRVPYSADDTCGLHSASPKFSKKAKKIVERTFGKDHPLASRYMSNHAYFGWQPVPQKISVYTDELQRRPFNVIHWNETYFRCLEVYQLIDIRVTKLDIPPYVYCNEVEYELEKPTVSWLTDAALKQCYLGSYVRDGWYSVRNDSPEFKIQAIWSNNCYPADLYLKCRWSALRKYPVWQSIWQSYRTFIEYFDERLEYRHI